MSSTTNGQNPFADPQPRSRSQPPTTSIPGIMIQPSEDDISNFEAITGCFDRQVATRFLQGAGSLETAINYYYDNPKRYDTKSLVFDESLFSADRDGQNASNTKAFQIEPYDEDHFARNTTRTQPQSPRNSLDVHYSPQENGVIGGNYGSSQGNFTSTFGPATREHYEDSQWALTTAQPGAGSASVTEIIPDVEIPLRVRINGEPVFIKPLGADPLPALLSTLAQIPLAKKVILECGPHLADYGEGSSWWQGTSFPWSTERVEIEWDIPEEEANQLLATQKQQDDAELIYETQRLMAFMDGSERLYGSAEPLSRLPAMEAAEKLPEVEDIQLEPMDQLDRFIAAWSSAMWTQAGPEAQLFRIEIEAGKGNFFPAFSLDVPIPSSTVNSGRTLYDKLDYILWYSEGASGSPMLESQVEDNDPGPANKEWAETEMCFRRAPPILIIKLRPMVTVLGSLGVDVPATLWLDRYMDENKEAAKIMRRNVMEVRKKIRKVTEQIDSLEMVTGQRDEQFTLWVDAENGGVPTSMDLLDMVVAYLVNAKPVHEEEEFVDDLDLSSSDEMDLGLELETEPKQASSLALKLQSLQVGLENRLSALKIEREDLQKELEVQSDLLKGPPSTSSSSSPVFPSSDLTEAGNEGNDKFEVEASSSKAASNIQKPKYKYYLRGVSTNARNVFLRQGSEDDWPMWTRISWDLDGDINRQPYSEESVLESIQSDSSMTILIFANQEACKEQDIHMPDALQTFVDRDNLFFRIERGQIGSTYGYDPLAGIGLNPSPPNTESPSSQAYEMLDSDQMNQQGQLQAQGEDDDPPPYSSSAAEAAAQAQAGLEMQAMMLQRGLHSHQHRNQMMGLDSIARGSEEEPLSVPISGYEDAEEGEVQEIHLTERDVISSNVEGVKTDKADVQMQMEEPAEHARHNTPGETAAVLGSSTGAKGSISPTSVTMSGVKRSFED